MAATALSLGFLLLPIVAIFTELSLTELRDGLTSDVARDALRVTAETNLVAMALIIAFGTPMVLSETLNFPAHRQVSSNIRRCNSLTPATDSRSFLVFSAHRRALTIFACSHSLSARTVVICEGMSASASSGSSGVAPFGS